MMPVWFPPSDYCYDPSGAVTALGGGNDNDATGTLQACVGECDKDSQCAAGLACFQRGASETIPGCSGGGTKGWDYCYNPTEYGSPKDPRGGTFVPGCAAYGYATVSTDYCWRDPGKKIQGDENDGSRCTTSAPCDECVGDCDSDADCKGSLKCFQRIKPTDVAPGCATTGHVATTSDFGAFRPRTPPPIAHVRARSLARAKAPPRLPAPHRESAVLPSARLLVGRLLLEPVSAHDPRRGGVLGRKGGH